METSDTIKPCGHNTTGDRGMRAAVLAERGKAGLTVTDFAEPVPAAGEAVMKVHAASINHVDLYMRDSGAGISHNSR